MMSYKESTLLSLLIASPFGGSAWLTTLQLHPKSRSIVSSPAGFADRSLADRIHSSHDDAVTTFRGLPRLAAAAGPFFGPEEEFTCPDEEECEIDWDKMPGFAEEEPEEVITNDETDEADVDMQPPPTFGTMAQESLDRGRVRLEMNWQIEECETDEDSCTDFCPDCAGSGRQHCRFCRGTGMVAFADDFRPCLICAKTTSAVGQEDCASCRGTGKIASWASTMEEHLKNNEEEQRAI